MSAQFKWTKSALLAGLALLISLVIIGTVCLVRWQTHRNANSSSAAAPNADPSALPRDPMVAITTLESKDRTGPAGREKVSVKIGVAPRVTDVKGAVEIRVFFFDLNAANELQPTDAQVDYEWLTKDRDWSDPAPKFLVATYRESAASIRSRDDVRFGGFIVRVFFDGRLQDERSEPVEIATALRSGMKPIVLSTPANFVPPSESEANTPPRSSSPARVADPRIVPPNNSVPVPAPTATPSPTPATASTAPYGSPAPGKPGFIFSPYDDKFLIDVRGFPPGTEVQDPNTGKPLRVP